VRPPGVFDRTNPLNPYDKYTVIHAIDCSGDTWSGNVTRDYMRDGVQVVQKGRANALATIGWLKAQVANGLLSSTLKELVIMGCSAGGIGVQVWAPYILDQLNWASAAVFVDSYVGIFPQPAGAMLSSSVGFCESGLLSPTLADKCRNDELTIPEMANDRLTTLDGLNVPMAFIQSKVDSEQIIFYNYLADPPIDDAGFYALTNEALVDHNQHPSFLAYMVGCIVYIYIW